MAFKFRLEASLKLARQKMDTAQGVLSWEMRVLLEIQRELDREIEVLEQALQGQAEDALRNPHNLNSWKLHIVAQKEKIHLITERLRFQESVVEECREALRECRILVEKFKRLKEKKWKEYVADEHRKEQAQLDEIGQRVGRE
ncbi:MAG: flagellar FliJ family protein [Peptococcaceae bacterium]|nr:flagellar FliJ family protein [Peptococcaceae bacterium]